MSKGHDILSTDTGSAVFIASLFTIIEDRSTKVYRPLLTAEKGDTGFFQKGAP